MAHLRSLITTCRHGGCTSRATERLMNHVNAPLGDYCTKHAKQHLREQERIEQRLYEQQRAAIAARERG